MKRNLPKLFCAVGDIVILLNPLTVQKLNQKIEIQSGTRFIVDNIVGYGFDLIGEIDKDFQIRVLNSEMKNYFKINSDK